MDLLPRGRRRCWLVAAVAVLACLSSAGPVLGDEPVRGTILVPIERVPKGGTFPVTGYGLDPGIVLSLTLRQGTASADVGTATVGADGTVTTSGTVPGTFVDGYAELLVTGSGGGQWNASVLVGTADPPSPSPGAADSNRPGVDARTIALGVFAVGLLIFIAAGVTYLRARRPT